MQNFPTSAQPETDGLRKNSIEAINRELLISCPEMERQKECKNWPWTAYVPLSWQKRFALQTATKHLTKHLSVSAKFGLQLLQVCLQKFIALQAFSSSVLSRLRLTAAAILTSALLSSPVVAIELVDLESFAAKGQHKQVVRQADKVISQNPNNPRPLFLKAQSLALLNRNSDAIAAYTQLTQKFPDLPEPFNNLATLYMSEGQLDQARIALEKALATNSAYNTAFSNLSAVYREMASRAYRQAMNNTVQIDPVRLTAVSELETWRPEPVEPVLLASNNNDLIPQSVISTTPKPAPAVEPTVVSAIEVVKAEPKASSSIEIADVTDIDEAQLVTEPDSIQIVGRSGNEAQKNTKPEDESSKVQIAAAAPATNNTAKVDKKAVREDLLDVVQQWAKAWSSKDVDSYLAHYASEFKPENSGLSRSAWEEQRRGRLKWRKYIRIAVQKPKVEVNGETAEVTFSQSYESDVYEDEVTKTLSMKRVENDWKITRERSEA